MPNGRFDPPNWAKVAVYLITHLGLNVLVIGLILAMWIGWLDSPMQQQHVQILESVDELIHVNRASCVNQAQDYQQRVRCMTRHH